MKFWAEGLLKTFCAVFLCVCFIIMVSMCQLMHCNICWYLNAVKQYILFAVFSNFFAITVLNNAENTLLEKGSNFLLIKGYFEHQFIFEIWKKWVNTFVTLFVDFTFQSSVCLIGMTGLMYKFKICSAGCKSFTDFFWVSSTSKQLKLFFQTFPDSLFDISIPNNYCKKSNILMK